MSTVGSGNPIVSDRSFVLRLSGSDRKGQSQQPVFIGTDELFRQIHDNELLILFSGRIAARQRGKLRHVVEPNRYFDLPSRLRMPAIDPVESRDIDPPPTEQRLQCFPTL